MLPAPILRSNVNVINPDNLRILEIVIAFTLFDFPFLVIHITRVRHRFLTSPLLDYAWARIPSALLKYLPVSPPFVRQRRSVGKEGF